MSSWRRLVGRLLLLVAVFVAGYLGATMGWLGTQEVGASHQFADVPDSAFYHNFVDFLVDNGITSGCGGGLFCGEQPVTRGQLAVFLKKLHDLGGGGGGGSSALWAVVRVEGTLARGSHATSADIFGGGYKVLFDQDVTNCAYVASIGGSTFTVMDGEISATRLVGNANGVFVATFDSTGANASRPFHLAVHC